MYARVGTCRVGRGKNRGTLLKLGEKVQGSKINRPPPSSEKGEPVRAYHWLGDFDRLQKTPPESVC